MHLLLWELIVTVEHVRPNAELIHLGYKKHDVKMESLLTCLSLSPIFCKSSNCRSIQVARVNITICETRGKYMLGKPQGKAKKCTWFPPYFHKSVEGNNWNNTSWKLSHKWLAKRIFKAPHDTVRLELYMFERLRWILTEPHDFSCTFWSNPLASCKRQILTVLSCNCKVNSQHTILHTTELSWRGHNLCTNQTRLAYLELEKFISA